MSKLLTWKTLTNQNQLTQIKHSWDELNNNSNNGNVFTSYTWAENWLKTFKQENWRLYVIAVFYNKKVIAIAPFYIQDNLKWYQNKTLYLIGQGEPEISEVASEYNDILIVESFEQEVIKGLKEEINTLGINQICFRAILHNSNIIMFLKSAYNYTPVYSHSRYLIECNDWSLAQLSKNTRSRNKRSLNQLSKEKAEFCWLNNESFSKNFHCLALLHQIRWQKKGKTGAFFHPDFKNFHLHLINTHPPKNIKMSAIMVNNQPVAIHYYLADKTTLYFYQSGWDEKNYANYSLGMALHLWSIQNCEYQHYDFMMGGINDSYKTKFMCQKLPMTNIQVNLSPNKIMFNKILQKFGLK